MGVNSTRIPHRAARKAWQLLSRTPPRLHTWLRFPHGCTVHEDWEVPCILFFGAAGADLKSGADGLPAGAAGGEWRRHVARKQLAVWSYT